MRDGPQGGVSLRVHVVDKLLSQVGPGRGHVHRRCAHQWIHLSHCRARLLRVCMSMCVRGYMVWTGWAWGLLLDRAVRHARFARSTVVLRPPACRQRPIKGAPAVKGASALGADRLSSA